MELALGSDTNLPLIYSIIIETASDKPLIDYHLKSTHFGETCQQGLQEGVLRKGGVNNTSECSL